MHRVTLKNKTNRIPSDVFDRKRRAVNQDMLRESTESHGQIGLDFIRRFPGCIIGFAKDFRITFWNNQCEKVFGYTCEELSENEATLLSLCIDEEKAKHQFAVWRQDGFVSTDIETELVTKAGELRYIRWSTIPDSHIFQVNEHLFVGTDVTDQRQAEQNLDLATRHLVFEREALRDKNVTLQELLGQIHEEKERLTMFLRSNVDAFVLPLFKRLQLRTGENEADYIRLIKNSLQAIISDIGRSHNELFVSLTPREVEICQMVRGGFSSKEIGGLINCSESTVRQHRRNIRKKLGINKKHVNLATFLQSGGVEKQTVI